MESRERKYTEGQESSVDLSDKNRGIRRDFNPSYEPIKKDSFGANPYSNDCCRCNPQRC